MRRPDWVLVLSRALRGLPDAGVTVEDALGRVSAHREGFRAHMFREYPSECHLVRTTEGRHVVRPAAPRGDTPHYVVPPGTVLWGMLQCHMRSRRRAAPPELHDVLRRHTADDGSSVYVPPPCHRMVGVPFLRYADSSKTCHYVDWSDVAARARVAGPWGDDAGLGAWLSRHVEDFSPPWLEGYRPLEWLAEHASDGTPNGHQDMDLKVSVRRRVAVVPFPRRTFAVFVDRTLSVAPSLGRLGSLGLPVEAITHVAGGPEGRETKRSHWVTLGSPFPASSDRVPTERLAVVHALLEKYLMGLGGSEGPTSDVVLVCPDECLGEYVDDVATFVRGPHGHAPPRVYVVSPSSVVECPRDWPTSEFRQWYAKGFERWRGLHDDTYDCMK